MRAAGWAVGSRSRSTHRSLTCCRVLYSSSFRGRNSSCVMCFNIQHVTLLLRCVALHIEVKSPKGGRGGVYVTHRVNGTAYPDQHLRCQQVPVFVCLQAWKSCSAGLQSLLTTFLQHSSQSIRKELSHFLVIYLCCECSHYLNVSLKCL